LSQKEKNKQKKVTLGDPFATFFEQNNSEKNEHGLTNQLKAKVDRHGMNGFKIKKCPYPTTTG